MDQRTRIRALIIFIIIMSSITLMAKCEASEEFSYKLNLLPWSYHHDRDGGFTNESHEGVGISVTLPNSVTYGVMNFVNSYGDRGWLVSTSTEFEPFGVIHPGIGVGYAPSYEKADRSVVIGWLSLRYKWLTLMTAPTEVTTIMLSIPID